MSLIDGKVDKNQAKKAIDALHAHTTKAQQKQQDTQLLPAKEQHVWLNVTVKKIASAHKFKPVKIPIVHPIVDPRTSAVCLITKDPQRQYKDLLAEQNIKFISRVVGIEKLKGKFKPFEARRMLLKENGLFLADERIVPLLPKLLGVKWFEAKKQPIPVCLTRKDLKGELERAISSTYMNQNQGTCTAIKLATTSHTPAQVLDNLALALPAIIAAIKGGWDNVQSLLIKTNSSAALPIWSCDLAEERWDGLVAEESDASDAEMEGVEADDEKEKKGKKRAVEEEEPKTAKKAKGANGKAVAADAEVPKSTAAAAPEKPSTPAGKKKSADAATPVGGKAKGKASVPSTAAEATPAEKKAKGKASATPAEKKAKGKASTTPAEKKKGAAKDKADAASTPSDAPKKSTPAKDSDTPKKSKKVDAPAPTPSDAPKKSKKDDKPASATKRTEPPAPSLSNDELKQKRVGKAGEGKKEKVVKGILKGGSGGKSAKDGVIGRKKAKFSQ
ncbi:ribosomal protein L1p/L10e family-domain-containing protein, partial [Mycena olivaceomarginata]